ncbi:MAG: antitoxin [Opitutales bacterium]
MAKLFKTGRSVAVRIPKAWVSGVEEVYLENNGDQITIHPKRPTLAEASAACREIGGGFPDRMESGESGVRVRFS